LQAPQVLDERDPLWSSLTNLTAGMSPEKRAQYLINLVENLKKVKS